MAQAQETSQAASVIAARSREEAIAAFGDGDGITVLGGGTIVMPEIRHGRLAPQRTLMLRGAGLSGVLQSGGRTTIGAMTPVSALEELPEPLGSTARGVADLEVRAQATVGGNLCAPAGAETPRGSRRRPGWSTREPTRRRISTRRPTTSATWRGCCAGAG